MADIVDSLLKSSLLNTYVTVLFLGTRKMAPMAKWENYLAEHNYGQDLLSEYMYSISQVTVNDSSYLFMQCI